MCGTFSNVFDIMTVFINCKTQVIDILWFIKLIQCRNEAKKFGSCTSSWPLKSLPNVTQQKAREWRWGCSIFDFQKKKGKKMATDINI